MTKQNGIGWWEPLKIWGRIRLQLLRKRNTPLKEKLNHKKFARDLNAALTQGSVALTHQQGIEEIEQWLDNQTSPTNAFVLSRLKELLLPLLQKSPPSSRHNPLASQDSLSTYSSDPSHDSLSASSSRAPKKRYPTSSSYFSSFAKPSQMPSITEMVSGEYSSRDSQEVKIPIAQIIEKKCYEDNPALTLASIEQQGWWNTSSVLESLRLRLRWAQAPSLEKLFKQPKLLSSLQNVLESASLVEQENLAQQHVIQHLYDIKQIIPWFEAEEAWKQIKPLLSLSQESSPPPPNLPPPSSFDELKNPLCLESIKIATTKKND